MRFDILTIFPRSFDSYFKESIIGRAQRKKIIKIKIHDLRSWTNDRHRTVDAIPYGGGAGMVLKIEPIFQALKELQKKYFPKNKVKRRVILFSAKGKVFTQKDARRLAQYEQLILICGRYEGVDERVAENLADEEISLGEFVLTGGEIPALTLVDAITRLLPGSLGNEQSVLSESHKKKGYLEHPHYTRPENFQGWKVPAVLLSGHHKKIENWRRKHSGKL